MPPPFDGGQSIAWVCYRSTVPRNCLPYWNCPEPDSRDQVKAVQGVRSEMFRFSPRRCAAIGFLLGLPLTISFAVRAATDPSSSSNSAAPSTSTATDVPPAAYTAEIKVTGPTTQFHDSVTTRY